MKTGSEKKVAVRESWKTEPLPELRERLPFEATYSNKEYMLLVAGLIPEEMEDHWFIFFKEPWLYFHRSWTGICVYMLRLEQKATCWQVTEAWASQDNSERCGSINTYPMSIKHDLAMLQIQIHVLLHRDDGISPSSHLFDQIQEERERTGLTGSVSSETKKP